MAESRNIRIGILSNTLPAALRIYEGLATLPSAQIYIILCRAQGEARPRFLFKHLARWVTGKSRFNILRLGLKRRVRLLQRPLDHPESLEILTRLQLDVGLHKTGVIYREPTISSFRLGILNPHIGLLPRYRGRAVMEWSLLEGSPTGVTVFFIDRGIDTGKRIVLREEVDVSHCRSVEEAKLYLFGLDAEFFRRAVLLLQREGFSYTPNDTGEGRRYYVMSKLFRDVAEELLGGR
jgi:hypothetical protein